MVDGLKSFLQAAWDMASTDWAKDVGLATVENIVVPIVHYSLAAAVGAYAANKIIRRGEFETVNVSETYFVPSGVINPKTGEEFIDMHRNTIDSRFTFEKSFHGTAGKMLAKIMTKAANSMDAENRVAFPLIRPFVSKSDFEKYDDRIASHWRGYFSSVLNDEQRLWTISLKDRENPVTERILVLPVYEEAAEGSHYKVLCIPPSYMSPDGLPKPENLRVKTGVDENGRAIFEHDSANEAYQRYETLRALRNTIGHDMATWLSQYGVAVYTGAVDVVAKPAPVVG